MNNLITFTLMPEYRNVHKDYYPVHASRLVPDWYKQMQTYANKGENLIGSEKRNSQTMKRCMPVFDAITSGYLITTYTDMTVTYDNSKVPSVEWAHDPASAAAIGFHNASQVVGYKNIDLPMGAPKFKNPWYIKTPKGYSCLFIAPMHRPSNGFRIMEGVVDTDKYFNSVQFPFLFDDGFEGVIPAGTPIAQVIPFKRNNWEMKIGDDKDREEGNAILQKLVGTWIGGYRNLWRSEKIYK
jgi:hypothetical protein